MDKKKQALLAILEINKSGYAGVMSNGNIVDRRKHPNATPVQRNALFKIPEPKCIHCNNVFKTDCQLVNNCN